MSGDKGPMSDETLPMAPLQRFIGRGSVRWVQWGLEGWGREGRGGEEQLQATARKYKPGNTSVQLGSSVS